MRPVAHGLGRRIIALVVLLAPHAPGAHADAKPDPSSIKAQAITVKAQPISSFDPAHPDVAHFGRLEFRGGLVLTSAHANFGGWSGLALDQDGRRLVAISDTGVWLTGELTYEDRRPTGIADARLGPLLGFDGRPQSRSRDRDSEGFALVSGTLAKGEALISFEVNHRIWRYPVSAAGLGVPTAALPLPPETKLMHANKSLESVCQLKKGPDAGAIVTLAERFPSASPDHVGWLRSPDGRWRTLAIESIDDFYLTDCHGLDDGSMLVLERRFRWRYVLDGVRMRLRRFSADEIAAGGTMRGEILIAASKAEEIDNMEGLAVHRGADGELVITMISDDNFNPILQRTVLLQFALPVEGATVARPADGPLKAR